MRIHQKNNSIEIDQTVYIETIIDKFYEGNINGKMYNLPCDTNVKFCQLTNQERTSVKPYRELVGSLMFRS